MPRYYFPPMEGLVMGAVRALATTLPDDTTKAQPHNG